MLPRQNSFWTLNCISCESRSDLKLVLKAPFPRVPPLALNCRTLFSLIFGGMDGIITTFAVVAAVKGGDLPCASLLHSLN